jgi:hypothetical protein
MERARGSAAIRDFLRFAQFPLWFEIPLASPEGAVRVSVTDLRFGAPPEYRFIASADIDREGRIMESRFGFGAR